MMTWSIMRVSVICLFAVCCSSGAYNFGGIINGAQYITQFNFTVPEQSATIAAIFGVQNIQYSNTIMLASTSPITINLTKKSLSEMYSNQSSLLNNMDFFGAINGDLQLVNVRFNLSVNNTIYLAFFNLDQPTIISDKEYYLSLRSTTSSGLICFSCPWGSILTTSCQCSPCDNNHYGKQCDYYIQSMAEDQTYYKNLYSIMNSYYRIENPPERVKIIYSEDYSTNSIKLYVQFEKIKGDLAGPLNTYYDTMNISLSKLVTVTESDFVIKSKGRNIMLTLQSTSNFHNTNVVLRYENADGKSQVGLIVGLTIGVLAIITLIIVVCYCKKKRQIRRLPENSFYLSKKEINLYFPEIQGLVVLNILKETAKHYDKLMMDASEGRSQDEDGEQCVICLTTISCSEMVRVTYCKHIFHSHCLINWFSKNQNCPYCRHQCNREPSEAAYQKLCGGRNKINPQNLVRMILGLDRNMRPRQLKKIEKDERVEPLAGSFDIEDQMQYSISSQYANASDGSELSRQSSYRQDSKDSRKKKNPFKGKKYQNKKNNGSVNLNQNSNIHLNG